MPTLPALAPAEVKALLRSAAALREGLPGSTAEAAALVLLARRLSESLDLDRVAALVVSQAIEQFGASGAVLELVDDDDLVAVAVTGTGCPPVGQRIPLHRSLAGLALARRGAILSGEARAARGNRARTPVTDTPPNAVAVPVQTGGTIFGALLLHRPPERPFTPAELRKLAALAEDAGIALDNGRRLELHAVEEASAALTRVAHGSPRISVAGEAIARIVERAVGAEGVALGLTRPGDTTVNWIAARGALHEWMGRHGAPVAPTGSEDAVAHVPLVSGENRVIGVLALSTTRARYPAAARRLARLAGPVSVALELIAHAEQDHDRLEREQLLASALATMDQPVLILSLARRVRYANGAALREYGYSAEELGAMEFDTLVDSAVPARRVERSRVEIPGSTWVAEHVHRRRDGSCFPVSVMFSYIRDDAGDVCGQVLHLRNLSEERRVEAQLRDSEQLAALGELVAGVAHEVNNPLAGISALAELLSSEPLSPEQLESARLIKREADRAAGVIRDLLTFARRQGPSRAPVDLAEVVRLAARLRAHSLRAADVALELDFDPRTPPVLGDAARLQQVVLNLIINAEHALRDVAVRRLVIRAAPATAAADGVMLTIVDTGSGMTEEVRRRAFEPFFTTKPAGHGTGLGLSVSYGIIRAHDGTITVESEPGRGASFTIVLPAARDALSGPSLP
jgi:PAS domain S-box-containing protein